MSEPIVITIPHSLSKDEAVRRLKNGMASPNLPFLTIEREEWTGDLLDFNLKAMGQQASGTALVQDNAVQLTLVLPWLLQRFAELASGALTKRAQLLLEKK